MARGAPSLGAGRPAVGHSRRSAPRLLVALNHPDIASIYNLEEAEGVRFLVLELVEGDTLAERLAGDRAEVIEAAQDI